MSRHNLSPSARRYLQTAPLVAAGMFVYFIASGALKARPRGMAPWDALQWSLRSYWPGLVAILVGVAISTIVAILISDRRAATARTTVEAGRIRWQHIRWGLIGSAVLLLLITVDILVKVATGHWHGSVTALVVAWILLGPFAILFWRFRPTPKRLCFIETGDISLVADERTQQIVAKGGDTVVTVFFYLLVLIAAPYEAIVSGGWPVRTLVEIGALLVLQQIAFNYWYRRM